MSAVNFNYYINASNPMVLAANDALTLSSSQNAAAGTFSTASLFSVAYLGAV